MALQHLQAHHVQVNASKKGPGATLLQDGHPVTFASKAIMPMEWHHANIEHELFTCVFGAEQFPHILGPEFTVESDHKPPEQIILKSLANTPVHLQRMLLYLQDYDVTIKY